MQAGFAMVETGFTRAKNAGNIIMKNLMDFCIGTPVFWLVGFGIMFGTGNWLFGFDFRYRIRSKLWTDNASGWSSVLGISDFSDGILLQHLQQLFPVQWLREQNSHLTASTVS